MPNFMNEVCNSEFAPEFSDSMLKEITTSAFIGGSSNKDFEF